MSESIDQYHPVNRIVACYSPMNGDNVRTRVESFEKHVKHAELM